MHFLSLWTALSICGPLTAEYTSFVDDVRPASGRNLVQVQVQSKAEMMAGAVRAYYSHLGPRHSEEEQTTSWKAYRYFPSMPPQPPVGSCKNIGRQYPPLVSRNLSIVQRYDRYACDPSHNDTFVTDPLVALAAEMTHLEGGCINLNRWPSRIVAANSSHAINLTRTCGEKCDQNLTGLAPVLVDDDMLVISNTKLPAGMEYQHMLLEFLPAAWTLTKHLKSSNMKLVTHIPLQKAIIAYLGIPEEKVLELPFPKEGRFLLCTPKLLHLWRVAPGDRTLSGWPSKYISQYGDLWHRLLAFRVGPDLSNAIATAVHLDSREDGSQITFLHRCVAQQINEAEALAATSKALLNRNRPEKLVSTCAGRQTWLHQLAEVRKSALLIGAYGGAMANTVFMRHGTGIIEIVNSPDTQLSQLNATGHWPPYKSHWFGGAGAAVPFFKVVLYEANENGELVVRIDDLEEALQQWFDYRPLQDHGAGPAVLPSG